MTPSEGSEVSDGIELGVLACFAIFSHQNTAAVFKNMPGIGENCKCV